MNIYKSCDEIIGNTPLLELSHMEGKYKTNANLFAKLEYFNPTGSIKDRAAKAMFDDAEQRGRINKDTVIIEPTSGNTGIALASVAAARGYKSIIVMPDTMSVERQRLMKAYGAKLVLSEGSKGMQGAVDMAEKLKAQNPNSFIPGQFYNPANAKAHYDTTGPEIWDALDGNIDIFIAGVGTGGTLTGAGTYLKRKNPNVKIIAVEPADSPLLSKGAAGPHKIQGIGPNFIPDVLDTDVYDEVFTITLEESMDTAKAIAKNEGFLVGISSGAAAFAAIQIAKRPENANKNIVVILPDSADRYYSTSLFTE